MQGNEIAGETNAKSSEIGMITLSKGVFYGRVWAWPLRVRSISSFMYVHSGVGQLWIQWKRWFLMGLSLSRKRIAQLCWVFGSKRMSS